MREGSRERTLSDAWVPGEPGAVAYLASSISPTRQLLSKNDGSGL